jgi:hypothetical protein
MLKVLDGDINAGETIVARPSMPALTSDEIASAVWADTECDGDLRVGHGPNV